MADKKISQLTAATTPLAGTEVLPIVQSGTTVKVSVDNLTAGKAVSMSSATVTGDLTVDTTTLKVDSTNNRVGIGTATPGLPLDIITSDSTAYTTASGGNVLRLYNSNTGAGVYSGLLLSALGNAGAAGTASVSVVEVGEGSGDLTFTTRNSYTSLEKLRIAAAGDVTVKTGNLVIGTSGKGIDFSATASGSGTMTSELLADYEEGTWTPVLQRNSGTFACTYTSRTGLYTKIGNQVTLYAKIVIGTISNAGSNNNLIQNAPFLPSSITGVGVVSLDSALTTDVKAVQSNIYNFALISTTGANLSEDFVAGGTLEFTITYFV